MMTAWKNFCRTIAAFRKARGGNVAIIFAIAGIPVMGFIGTAYDYSHANAVKAAVQAALDSTALMLSKDTAGLSDGADMSAKAATYFNALFTPHSPINGINVTSVTATYHSTNGSSVLVDAYVAVPTSFLAFVGTDKINVHGTSSSAWGSNRLRVALVLDNTGSMADNGKITALISATNSLLTQLRNAASTNGDVYVSIIPFVKDVNLGATNWNSNWIYWDDAAKSDDNSWDANNGSCSVSGYSPRSQCVAQSSCSISGYTTQSTCTGAGTCSVSGKTTSSSCTSAGTCSISGSSHNTQSTCTTGVCSISGKTTQNSCTSAGTCSNAAETTQSSCTGNNACSKSQYTSKNSCQNNGGTWGKGTWTAGVWTAPGTWTAGTWTPGTWTAATWTPNNHNTWNGCVMDRGNSTAPDSNNYDTNVGSPDVTIPGSLYAAEQYGSCPQAVMGLSYNWTSMTSLVNAMSPAGNTNQAIGLQLGWMSLVGGGPFTVPAMQSGYNYTQIIILLTDGLNTQDRWYTDQNSIDTRQAMTCTNIKNAGVIIYTIQVNTGGDPTSTLLQNCASDSTKTWMLTSASQIMTVFTAIGTNLTQLRVAR